MAGHSHWSKIKRAKGANDAKRGKIWSKIARKIIISARSGGGDPRDNLNLRYIIDEARAVNMPKDTIEKAIAKGTGELGGEQFEAVMYEGYGPGGVSESQRSHHQSQNPHRSVRSNQHSEYDCPRPGRHCPTDSETHRYA